MKNISTASTRVTLFLWVILFTVALFSLPLASYSQEQSSQGFVITNVTIVSPEKENPAETGYVIIKDGKILEVFTGESISDFSDYTIIDGSGKYLIPGLMDAHVHLSVTTGMNFEGIPPDFEKEKPELVKKFREQLPRSYLYFGFTTLIDLGAPGLERVREIQNAPASPDIYHTGAPLVISNGYPMVFFPEELRYNDKLTKNFLLVEGQEDSIPAGIDPLEHTPEATVKTAYEEGATVIKSYLEKGWWAGNPLPTPSKEMLSQVLNESRKYGLPFAVHANNFGAHKVLADVGVDIIAHGMWNWGNLDGGPNMPEEVREVLDVMIEKNTGYVPTMQTIAGIRDLYDESFLEDPQLKNVLPAEMIEWYKTKDGQWFADQLRDEDFDGLTNEKIIARMNNYPVRQGKMVINYLADNGGNILFGTDTPASPSFANPPGYNGYLELLQMYEAGVPLDKILRSATIDNAKAFKLDHLIGTIEKGKKANLLLLSKNPLEDITAYDSIEEVIINGKLYNRDKLSSSQSK